MQRPRPRHASPNPRAWRGVLRGPLGRVLALVAVVLVAVIVPMAGDDTPPALAQSGQGGHSDWAPFVGTHVMWCTASTGEPGPCATHHNGWAIDVDIPFGEPVHAAGPGVVVQRFDGCRPRGGDGGCNGRGGNWIAIDHGEHRSRYMHLARIADGIEVGTVLQGGEIVGTSGNSGTSGGGGVHLHYDETTDANLPVQRIFFGPMLACHGDRAVQYPNVLGYTDWQDVPHGTQLRNDGYECLGGVTPDPLPDPPPVAPPGPPPVTPIEPRPGGATGLAFGDFSGNGADSLAIGIPGDVRAGRSGIGAVAIADTSGRRAATQLLRQGRLLGDRARIGDYTGAAVATGDFDCDGRDDLAVGAPGDRFRSADGAGLVSVTYGGGRTVGRPTVLRQGAGLPGTIEGNELTGGALATGDLDGDGCDDLVVGAPGEDIDGATNAGTVLVAWGAPGGIGAGREPVALRQGDGGGLAGDLEGGDLVGATVATGDFDCDGIDDLAVGVPGEDIDGFVDSGAVVVVTGGASGFGDSTALWQSSGLAGILEAGDRVGSSLATGDMNGDGCDDLAVGAPGEDLDPGAFDAGAVSVAFGSPSGLADTVVLYQGTRGLRGVPKSDERLGTALAMGDFDCDGRDDLAIGAPGEQRRRADGAGWVGVVRGSARGVGGGLAQMTQSRTLPGQAEAGDGVGTSLAAGDANGDGCDDLAIGAPGEDLGPRVDAGEVTLLFGGTGGLGDPRTFSQRSGIPGRSSNGDLLAGPGIDALLSLGG